MSPQEYDDEKLKRFMQKHQPIAPPLSETMLQTLLARLGFSESKRKTPKRSSARWFAAGSFVAASLAVVLFTSTFVKSTFQAVPKMSSAVTEMSDSGEDADLDSEDLPTLDVGGDYYDLIAEKSN